MTDSLTLADAIKMVLPHASTDKTLTALTGVHITASTVMATDRYTCARVTIPTGIPEDQQLLLPPNIAKRGVAAINQDAGGWFASCTDGAVIRFTPIDAAFPPIAQLFDSFTPAEAGQGPAAFGFTAAFAEKFATKALPGRPAANRGELLRLEADAGGPGKPVRVTFPSWDQYAALWVPVRLSS